MAKYLLVFLTIENTFNPDKAPIAEIHTQMFKGTSTMLHCCLQTCFALFPRLRYSFVAATLSTRSLLTKLLRTVDACTLVPMISVISELIALLIKITSVTSLRISFLISLNLKVFSSYSNIFGSISTYFDGKFSPDNREPEKKYSSRKRRKK